MKKAITLYSVMIIMMITLLPCKLAAQTNKSIEEFFVGNWDIVVKDLANYDINLSLEFRIIEGEFKGEISMTGYEGPATELKGISIVDPTLSVDTDAVGFSVPLTLTKKDEKTVTGSFMGFPFESTRSDPK